MSDLPVMMTAIGFTWDEDIEFLQEERDFALAEWRTATDEVSRVLWNRLYDHLDWAVGTLRVIREVQMEKDDESVDLEQLAANPSWRAYLLGKTESA